MKSNSNKRVGFALIEVVISIAILSILSICVYNGFMIIIKQTKEGQVKQTAALEGKRVIEKMKSTSFQVPSTTSGAALSIGDISLNEEAKDGSVFYRRYLGENYNNLNENDSSNEKLRKYTEKVTLTRKDITLNNNQTVDELANTSNINYKVYVGKEKVSDSVARDYIKDENSLNKDLGDSPDKISMYIYFETPSNSQNSRIITIKDFNGVNLLRTTQTLPIANSKVNLCINFNDYKSIESSPKLDDSDLRNVEIYVYNRTNSAANVYLQKDSIVDADVKVCKGEINIYDNRAEDVNEGKIGTLYDIKVEISDYKKYINGEITADNDNLFTGYYEKNIE